MGLVLDSSVLIAAERGKGLGQLLSSLAADHSETEFLLSSITVMELEHGWHRANTPEIAIRRRRYIDEVLAVIPVEPFTREMASLAKNRCSDEERRAGYRDCRSTDWSDCTLLWLRYWHSQHSSFSNDPWTQSHFSLAVLYFDDVSAGSANATYAPLIFTCVAGVNPTCADAQNTTYCRPFT